MKTARSRQHGPARFDRGFRTAAPSSRRRWRTSRPSSARSPTCWRPLSAAPTGGHYSPAVIRCHTVAKTALYAVTIWRVPFSEVAKCGAVMAGICFSYLHVAHFRFEWTASCDRPSGVAVSLTGLRLESATLLHPRRKTNSVLWAGMLLLTGQFTVFYWLTWCEGFPSATRRPSCAGPCVMLVASGSKGMTALVWLHRGIAYPCC